MKLPTTTFSTIVLILIFGSPRRGAAQENISPETTSAGKVYSPATVKTLQSGEEIIEVQQVLPAPTSGIFYPMYGNFPPTPFPPNPDLDLPVYFWGEGIFLFDDERLNFQTLRESGIPLFSTGTSAAKTESMEMLTNDAPPPPGEGGGGDSEPYPLPPPFSYTNGLWLSVFNCDSNWMALLAHGTVADEYYEILTKTSLSETNWTVDHGFIGQTDLTLASPISVVGQSNLFFWARNSGRDEDGDGLPDWWEMENELNATLSDTGNTGTSDGYKDGDQDGWSNLEEYQNGTSPSGFNTPPPPRGLTVALNSSGTVANLNWNPSGGAVTGYAIEFAYYTTAASFSVSATNQSFSDTSVPAHANPNYYPPAYRILANYAAGNSAWSPFVSVHPPPASAAFWLVRGPGGRSYLVSSGVSSAVTSVRVTRQNYPELITFDLSWSSFTNGIALVPVEQIPAGSGDHYWVQTVSGNETNDFTYAGNSLEQSIQFFDGREQLKQNLAFVLRAADMEAPFDFILNSIQNYGIHWGTENYAYASFYNLFDFEDVFFASPREFRPFEDNYIYRNFAYDSSHLNSSGRLTNGIGTLSGYDIPLLTNSSAFYKFQAPTNVVSISAVLSSNDTTRIYHQLFPERLGLTIGSTNVVMDVDPKNIFGLDYISVRKVSSSGTIDIYPGNNVQTGSGYYYPEAAQPMLRTVDYYFGRAGVDPFPGSLYFDPTNTTPLLIVSGNHPTYDPSGLFRVGGYAKQSIDNGDTNKFAYLGLYFDKAYKVNSNGTISTNETGILSEYGEFFPTEPGRVVLRTKPASVSETNVANCLVHAIKIELDVNHDGTIDRSITGSDNTSYYKPLVFWVNTDNDSDYISDEFPGKDRDLPKKPDNADGEIKSVRDLEDFARLWVSGLPVNSGDLHATLRWEVYSGDPAIKLYRATETNGGIGYLTNLTTAKSQIDIPGRGTQYDNELRFAYRTIAGIDPVEISFNGNDLHFIFEGAGIGSGELVLTILKGTEPLAQTSAFFDLKDIKQMYERVSIDNVTSGLPPSSLISRYAGVQSPATPGETPQLIVFVHGINISGFESASGSETMLKRLYWSGYQGRFASVRWPCSYLPPDEIYNALDILKAFNYNKGEFQAWKSANGFGAYLQHFSTTYTNYQINILAHSQGNVVVSEALKLGAPFDNYILSQAAVPAHSFDTNAPFLQKLLDAEGVKGATPLTAADGGYHGYFTNLTGRLINFYNTNDFALATGTKILPFPLPAIETNWERNHETEKPEIFGEDYYHYDGTNCLRTYLNGAFTDVVTDSYEKKAVVARSRSRAIGAQWPATGQTSQGVISATVDLEAQFGFERSREEHSAQLSRPLQKCKGYFDQVIDIIDQP